MAVLDHNYELLAAQYREYLKRRNLAERTVNEYPAAIRRFLSYLQYLKIDDIRDVRLNDLQGYQTESVGLSISTQRGRLALLRNFFGFLHRTGKIYINPAPSLEAPRLPRRLPRNVLSIGEVAALLKQPDLTTFVGVRDRAMLELMYSTGLRNSEVRGIQLPDLDLAEEHLRVMGKGRKEAYVPIGRQAHKALEHYILFWRSKLRLREPWVFVSARGRIRLSSNDLRRSVKRYARAAGIEKACSPHSLRHSCATHLLQQGADIRLIQELLRHRDLSSTQVYTHVDISDLKEAQRKYHPRERGNE